MGWNGSGGYTLPEDFTADLAAGPPASTVAASKVDNQFDDIKGGLINCLTRDGQNSPSANISWNNQKITNLAAPTSGGDATNKTYVDGLTYAGTGINALTAGTIATGDFVLIADVSDSNNPKKVTAQSIADLAAPSTPVGSMVVWPAATAPTSWLLCHGQDISRTTYAALFALIGTTFGVGDGSTTFNLPDLRGRTVFGLDNMGGSDAGRLSTSNTLGTTGGAETKSGSTDGHALTTAQMPNHTHGQTLGSLPMVRTGSSGGSVFGNVVQTSTTATDTQCITNSAGSGDTHAHNITNFNVMPPFITLNWIIKVL